MKTNYTNSIKLHVKLLLLVPVFLILAGSATQAQSVIHYWNFNSGNTGLANNEWPSPVAPSYTENSSMLTHNFYSTIKKSGNKINAQFGDKKGYAFAVQGMYNNGRSLTLEVPTTEFENIVLRYATKSKTESYTNHTIEYSSDGIEFIYYTNLEIPKKKALQTVDFTGVPGVKENPNFKIRITLSGATKDKDYSQIDNITVTGTEGMPVELVSFSATAQNSHNAVELSWKTATEINNYGFEIERTSENEDWERIGFVEGHGNSNAPREYSFVDKNASKNGTLSYRLKQVDVDGQFEYSNVVEISLGSLEGYELAQNYPNPFNPSTKIAFTIPESGQVRLSVYNLIGEEVATLANGDYNAGSHSVNFNASDLTSGFYVYKLEAANYSQVKKMMLLK